MQKLTIELVPETSFYNNVRTNVTRKEWDIIRKKVYKIAGSVCEVCGGVGKRHPVEAHEIWEFNDEDKIQTLTGMIALCPDCHGVKHIGLSRIRGLYHEAVEHLEYVNDWSNLKCEEYIAESFAIWHERSKIDWKLDISFIKSFLI